MKKLLAACSALVLSTSLASADTHASMGLNDDPYDLYSNFYFGGDIGYNKFSLDDAAGEDNLPFMNVYGGYNFSDTYAIEVGTFFTKEEGGSNGAESLDTNHYGMFVDAVGKYEMYNNLDLIGTVGIQYSKLKIKGNAGTDFSETEFAPRLGLGAEYAFNDKMKVRGMARYVFSDFDNATSDTMQYTIGLNYAF
jgi:opacity protein-like surface antigen